MPLGDTVLDQVELGPATELDSGTTDASGNSEYTVVNGGGNFDSAVKAGDWIVLTVAGSQYEGALITSITHATDTLTISRPISDDAKAFKIVRPMECLIRPHMQWEWEIHNIVVSPRIDAGDDEHLRAYPVEVWSTDDNKPKTLLLTTADHGVDLGDANIDYPHLMLGVARFDVSIKPTYFGWLLVRNCQPVRVDLYVGGLDKSIQRED